MGAGLLLLLLVPVLAEDVPEKTQLVYGYEPGEVTHGIGYGHHLHPFYYRGKRMKYYKCALEDDWKPFEGTAPSKDDLKDKNSPPKKYAPTSEKHKFYLKIRKQDSRKPRSRSDGFRMKHTAVDREHAKLLRDINGMSERQPFHRHILDKDHLRPDLMDDAHYPGDEPYLHQHQHQREHPDEPTRPTRQRLRLRTKRPRVISTTGPSPMASLQYPPQKINDELKMATPPAYRQATGHPFPFASRPEVNTVHSVRPSGPTGQYRQGRVVRPQPPLSMVDKLLRFFPKIL